ncbi:hypothetical protein J2045_002984 [Peteryoungia aggregata LMG 23059]|uniref:DUF1905 domain-containing protein n=1 Tax=Peteryoungia aggregata LMG 23059 TaxID=1368425 RepID=A0ABU0G9B5_9HYPH|nr:DUF1905 domain-containing protein [Peteryoungia aggregata]MDQ0421940.1 hypothetical protein [Peteryoungia aggregata LMG 23059]
MSTGRREIRFEAEVIRFDAPGGWHGAFLTEEATAEARFFGRANALGTIAVEVQIGASTARTCLFPDSRRKSYLLPLKAALRKREALVAGRWISVILTLCD